MFQDTWLPLSEPVTMEMNTDRLITPHITFYLTLSVGCEV